MESLYRVVNCLIYNAPSITCNRNAAHLELLQVSVTCMNHVAPQTRDNNLHPDELLYLIRSVQSAVWSPETEKLCLITYHWFFSSVIIKDIWDNRK